MSACVFCRIVEGSSPATIIAEWPEAIAIVPVNPVVAGHLLVLPRQHVADFAEDPAVTADTMRCAAQLVNHRDANLITSKGAAATQSVFHLHVHIVPRSDSDGLHLPWTGQTQRALHAPHCRAPGGCAWDAGAPSCGCNCHVREQYRDQFPLDGIDHYAGAASSVKSGEPTND